KFNTFNIGNFKYPSTTLIVEINEGSKVARQIHRKELEKLSTANDNNLTSICQYYVRDNRLFELYMLLRYLSILKLKGERTCNRKDIEEQMIKTETINNKNWRNAWISLSSLGFVNSTNLPTASGIIIGYQEYAEFAYMMYISYIKPFVDTIMTYLSNESNLTKSYKEICTDLRTQYGNKDVLFLTQSNGRYLSSWLNILRDDYGCIDFESRSKNRIINYVPETLNKNSFLDNIKKYTNSQDYILNLAKVIG
ncbi:MAG: hypothetical protein B6226_05575, partial [Candidatus Cloacimonetes bacterium 4572_65]